MATAKIDLLTNIAAMSKNTQEMGAVSGAIRL